MPVLIFRQENNKKELGGLLTVAKKDSVEELYPYDLWLINENIVPIEQK